MDELLLDLLEGLERIADQHEELYDTEVRERMGLAIMDGFVRNKKDYEVPSDMGMSSVEANAAVHSAVTTYIDAANKRASTLGIRRFFDRLAAFQNGTVVTKSRFRRDFEEFFGHTPPEFYDENGNAIRTH
jgi:hypothetical protein